MTPKTWTEMSAEALRDAAVLVLVFGLLDKFIVGGPSGPWTVVILAVAAVCFVAGGVLEKGRRK